MSSQRCLPLTLRVVVYFIDLLQQLFEHENIFVFQKFNLLFFNQFTKKSFMKISQCCACSVWISAFTVTVTFNIKCELFKVDILTYINI